jgi:hypothetical protein
MAQTATTLASVLKEAWTSDRIQKQFYSGDAPLSRFEKVKSTMIGKQAQVPIHKPALPGSRRSVRPAARSTRRATRVDQAAYTLVTLGQPISIELSALNQAGGSNLQSVISAKDLEIEGAISDLRRQGTRMAVTNGDGIVAQCATGGASTTVSLVASPSGTAWGYDAIQRGWLQVGMTVDIGTTSDTDTLVTGTTISAI